MTTVIATNDKIHVWEDKGLGVAPFRVVSLLTIPSQEMAEKNPLAYQDQAAEVCRDARSLGVGIGTCDVCGTAIMSNYVIESADHKRFVCGCDCVEKSGDAGLVERVKLIQRKAARAKKEAAMKARWETERPMREERQRRLEQEQAEREARETALRAQFAEKNRWLLTVLDSHNHTPGGFVESMIAKIEVGEIRNLSERCLSILEDIYAKDHGRSGSNKYEAAAEEFRSNLQ